MLIWDRAHSGWCPFGIVSIHDCVHLNGVQLRLRPFGMVSIWDCVYSESCTGSTYHRRFWHCIDSRHEIKKTALKSWLVVQNLRIALSRTFISFEAFRLTLIKKDRQNGEHRKGRVFIKGAER